MATDKLAQLKSSVAGLNIIRQSFIRLNYFDYQICVSFIPCLINLSLLCQWVWEERIRQSRCSLSQVDWAQISFVFVIWYWDFYFESEWEVVVVILIVCLLIDWSGEAQQVEWSKIQTPTDKVVVPYDSLASIPEGIEVWVWIWL